MESLTDVLKETLAALVEANEHIQEKLQPEFERLAQDKDVSRTEDFGRHDALMRLATWWHGVGTYHTIEKATAALEAAAAASGPAVHDPASAAMRNLINAQLATCWTPDGVAAWWDRQRTQLSNKTPAEAFATDPMSVHKLAVAGRSQGSS